MLILKPLLLAGVLPAAVVLGLLLASRIRRRKPGESLLAIAPTIGFVVSFAAAFGWPAIPPAEHWQRIAYVAAGAGIVGVLVAIRRMPVPVRIAIASCGVAAASRAVVPDWDELHDVRLAWAAIAAVLIASAWLSSLDVTGNKTPTRQFGLLMISLAASALLMKSSNATLAQLAGAIASVIGAMWLASLLGWHESRWSWAVCPAFVLPSLLLLGKFYDYGSVPDSSFVTLAAAPVWLLLGDSLAACSPRKWLAISLRLLTVALPIAAAFLLLATTQTR